MRSIIANKSHQEEFNIWVMKNWSELVFFKMYGYVRDLHNRVVIYCIWSALYIFQTAKGEKRGLRAHNVWNGAWTKEIFARWSLISTWLKKVDIRQLVSPKLSITWL